MWREVDRIFDLIWGGVRKIYECGRVGALGKSKNIGLGEGGGPGN